MVSRFCVVEGDVGCLIFDVELNSAKKTLDFPIRIDALKR